MRVLLLSTSWFDFYVVELARALASRHEVHVVVDQHDRIFQDLASGSLFIHPIPWYASRRRPGANVASTARLRRLAHRIKPDVVHVQEHDPRYLAAYIFLRTLPTVFDDHNVVQLSGMGNSILDRFKDWVIARSDGVIVHGEAMRIAFQDRYALPNTPINVLPFGKFSVFGEAEAKTEVSVPLNILFFGRNQPYKGLMTLIDASRILSSEPGNEFVVTIVGEGCGDKMPRDVLDNPRFRFLGTRVNSPAPFFEAADVVVLPYQEGSTSGVTPVAYAYGRPVVVTAVGSLPEVVDDGRTGFVVPPSDPAALAGALQKIISNPESAHAMGANARLKLDTELSWGKNLHHLETNYLASIERFRNERRRK